LSNSRRASSGWLSLWYATAILGQLPGIPGRSEGAGCQGAGPRHVIGPHPRLPRSLDELSADFL
jgi:hypothetical protein